jgi:hypothetical protein
MLAVTLLMPIVTGAQDVTAPELKAAFIYNFVKFTEWPDMPPVSDPFVICVIRDAAVGGALGREVKGREFSGRRIAVLSLLTRPTESCRVLYVSGGTGDEARQAIAGLEDSPLLTISDVAGFIGIGGMVQFFFERGQLRFTIRADAVRRSGLRMNAALLALGQR